MRRTSPAEAGEGDTTTGWSVGIRNDDEDGNAAVTNYVVSVVCASP